MPTFKELEDAQCVFNETEQVARQTLDYRRLPFIIYKDPTQRHLYEKVWPGFITIMLPTNNAADESNIAFMPRFNGTAPDPSILKKMETTGQSLYGYPMDPNLSVRDYINYINNQIVQSNSSNSPATKYGPPPAGNAVASAQTKLTTTQSGPRAALEFLRTLENTQAPSAASNSRKKLRDDEEDKELTALTADNPMGETKRKAEGNRPPSRRGHDDPSRYRDTKMNSGCNSVPVKFGVHPMTSGVQMNSSSFKFPDRKMVVVTRRRVNKPQQEELVSIVADVAITPILAITPTVEMKAPSSSEATKTVPVAMNAQSSPATTTRMEDQHSAAAAPSASISLPAFSLPEPAIALTSSASSSSSSMSLLSLSSSLDLPMSVSMTDSQSSVISVETKERKQAAVNISVPASPALNSVDNEKASSSSSTSSLSSSSNSSLSSALCPDISLDPSNDSVSATSLSCSTSSSSSSALCASSLVASSIFKFVKKTVRKRQSNNLHLSTYLAETGINASDANASEITDLFSKLAIKDASLALPTPQQNSEQTKTLPEDKKPVANSKSHLDDSDDEFDSPSLSSVSYSSSLPNSLFSEKPVSTDKNEEDAEAKIERMIDDLMSKPMKGNEDANPHKRPNDRIRRGSYTY